MTQTHAVLSLAWAAREAVREDGQAEVALAVSLSAQNTRTAFFEMSGFSLPCGRDSASQFLKRAQASRGHGRLVEEGKKRFLGRLACGLYRS
jgi:hypothetical protein